MGRSSFCVSWGYPLKLQRQTPRSWKGRKMSMPEVTRGKMKELYPDSPFARGGVIFGLKLSPRQKQQLAELKAKQKLEEATLLPEKP